MGGGSIPITITGSLDEVYAKLLAAKTVTSYRKESGWLLFQSDETWNYQAEHDDKTCPWCLSLESYFSNGLNGIAMPLMLPTWKRSHPTKFLLNNEIYPDSHELDYVYARGLCRCVATFLDYLPVLASRLMVEIGDMTA